MFRTKSWVLLAHKVVAIGASGLLGIIVVGAIYLIGASVQAAVASPLASAHA